MKKYLLLVLCLVSSVGFGSIVYCPESATCQTDGDKTACYLNGALGGNWRLNNQPLPPGLDGVYPLRESLAKNNGLCIYKVEREVPRIGNLFYTSGKPLSMAKKIAGNKWSVYDSCGPVSGASSTWECPFTDDAKADG